MDVTAAAQYCMDSLPDCPIPLLRRLVVEAVRDFCQETKIWRYWTPQMTLTANITDYDLTANQPDQSVIFDLVHVQINGQDILPYSEGALTPALDQAAFPLYSNLLTSSGNSINSGQNLTYNRSNVSTVTIVGGVNNSTGYPLTVEVAVMPAPGATCIPDIVWQEWFEAIEQFVKWKAMARPGESFSSPEMAAFHQTEYEGKRNQAKLRAAGGNMNKRYRTVGSDFG